MREKRKESRKKEENKITIAPHYPDSPSQEEKTVLAFTQDISPGGVRVITDTPFPVGTDVEIKIVLSRTRDVIDLYGKVRWASNISGEDLFEMGIEFMDVDRNKSMLLLKHIYGTHFLDE
jgi:Tfp pilus assembly protein PilZ